MKTIKVQSILTCLSMLILIQSCNQHQEESRGLDPSSGKQTIEGDVWKTETVQVDDALITSKYLTAEGEKKAINEVKETSLEPLNLPSTTNVNAFTMRGKSNSRTRQAVFISPKLYFYQKSDRAEVKARRIGNNVLIPMHAILVDGFSKEVPSPDGVSKIALPDSYLVDMEQLKNSLNEIGYTRETTRIGVLDGCAKSFTISDKGQTYDVTPSSVKESDYCEINRPFTLNLIVPAAQADRIINEALYLNEIDAAAKFAVKVGYVEADTNIQLDRSKIYESLQASLQGQYPPYAKADLNLKLKSIIQNETLNIFIKGDRNDVVSQLVKIALDSFVTPYELKSTEVSKTDCTDVAVCVSISYEKNKEQRTLEVSYQQYSTTMTEKTITTFAKPQQILFPEVVFNSENDEKGQFISNLDDRQNERDLAISVNTGTRLELFLNGFSHEIDSTHLTVSTSGHNECGSYDWTKRCEYHINYLEIHRSYAGVQQSGLKTFAGAVIGNPANEISLKFFRQDGTQTTCTLANLNANLNTTKAFIVIENSDSCQVFKNEGNKKEFVSIRLVNKLRDPLKLQLLDGRAPFEKHQTISIQDSQPTGDTTEYGGPQPSKITEFERELRIQIKVLVRKYSLEE